MIKIFLLFCFLLIFTVTQYNEIINARHDCHLQRNKDVALLSREVCMDQGDRFHFEGMVDCASAEERLRMNIPMCTIKRWLSKTDVVTIYAKLTESYWSIVGFVFPLIFIVMHFWYKERGQKYLRLREK